MLMVVFIVFLATQWVYPVDLESAKALLTKADQGEIGSSEDEIALQEPVNDTVYRVGPGDVFTIYLWGSSLTNKIRAEVNPEGRLVIPDMGVVRTGRILKEVKTDIASLVVRRTRGIDSVLIELSKVKSIAIPVSGEVPNPGCYHFKTTARLSDVLVKAFQDTAFSSFKRASLRNVRIEDTDGNTGIFDFENYLLNGDMSANPYLSTGDKVNVAVSQGNVHISGAITHSGFFDYRKESLYDFIRFCGGLLPEADSTRIWVSDVKNGKSNRNLRYPDECREYTMQINDFVVVGKNPEWPENVIVTIYGQVQNPGSYNMKPGATVSDLLQAAGGVRENGDINIAYLKRTLYVNNTMQPEDKGFSEMLTAQHTSAATRVNFPFDKVLAKGNSGYDERLVTGDMIYIPEKIDMVSIAGNVVNPGLVPWAEGKGWKYYIRQAGGFDKNAFSYDAKIYKTSKGAWVAANDVDTINAGDIIYVPPKPQFYTRNLVRDVFSIIGGVTAAVTTIVWIFIALN